MKGEQLARTANLLRAELRKQGINPTVVKPKSKPFLAAWQKGVGTRYRRVQPPLATMMKTGVPIVNLPEIIGGGSKNPTMKKMANSLRSRIEGGASIYEAMSQYPVH